MESAFAFSPILMAAAIVLILLILYFIFRNRSK